MLLSGCEKIGLHKPIWDEHVKKYIWAKKSFSKNILNKLEKNFSILSVTRKDRFLKSMSDFKNLKTFVNSRNIFEKINSNDM